MFIVIVLTSRGEWVEWSTCKALPSDSEVRLYDEFGALQMALNISMTTGQYAQYTTLSHLYSLNK